MKTIKIKRELSSRRIRRIAFIVIAGFWILVGLSSCSIERRLYRPGFHVEFKKNVRTVLKSESSKTNAINETNKSIELTRPENGSSPYSSSSIQKSPVALKKKQKLPQQKNNPATLFTKTTEKKENDAELLEQQQIKQEETSRKVLNTLLAGAVILFTYFEVWIPAVAFCLLLLLLIHCRPSAKTTVQKRAVRYKASLKNKPQYKPEYANQQVPEYYAGKRRVHAGAVLSLPFIFFPPLSFIGIILGGVALSDIKKQPNKYKGKVAATIGLVFNIIWTALILAIFVGLLIAF